MGALLTSSFTALRKLALWMFLLLFSSALYANENKALVIGISQYSEINSLRYADSDALEFSQILTSLAGYSKSDVSVLLNQDATKKRIVDEINKIVRASEKKPLDSFILMFAGHGIESTLTARNAKSKGEARETNIFLAPSDASIEENSFYSTGNGKEVSNETFINKAWLARQLSAIKAKSIFIILDSCYSGTKSFGSLFLENEGYSIQSFSAGGAKNGVADVKKRALVLIKPSQDSKPAAEDGVGNRKIAYLASSRDDQASAEYDELKHGALSYCIFEYIKRMRREINKGEKAQISIEDVYSNITKLFHETSVKGATLDAYHQPLLVPIPDFTDMKDMVLMSVTGTKVAAVKADNVKQGKLKINAQNSTSTDIEIYVDGLKRTEPINTTLLLPEGRHTVELYLPKTGYRNTFIADISAASPVTKSFSLTGELEVVSYWLNDGVKSEGPLLDVSLDGKPIGTSGAHFDNILAGTHQIEVRYKNVMKSRQVEIRPDSPLHMNYSVIREAAPVDTKKVRNVVF